ncbi:MAG: TIGR03016 family PEP-CTERM system-associated outer membrane protein [Casimicrobiaceae bacterium]
MARDIDRRCVVVARLTQVSLLAFAVYCGVVPVHAQSWRIVPQVTVTETLSDNITLAPAGRRESELVTDISPSLSIDGKRGRSQLRLEYQMHNLLYAKESARNSTQHFLNAIGSVEAIENFFFIDGRASVTQEQISAFGTQPTNNTSVTNNRTESRTFQLSPYVRGQLASFADYLLRYSVTTYSSKADDNADYRVNDASGRLNGRTAVTSLGWTVEANRQSIEYDRGRDTEADRIRGILTYQFDPQFRVSTTAGYESNDYATFAKQSATTYGASFDWAPSARTNVNAAWEKRFFGNSWNYGFRYRTPLTAWSFSDRRDVTTNAENQAERGSGVAFDRLFNALASRIPDPLERALEVNRLLDQGGIPPDLNVPGDFLTTRVFKERRREASVTVIGARNNLTMAIFRADKEAISEGSGRRDDFDFVPEISESGVNVGFSHRLTPLSSVSALASWQRSSGDSRSATNANLDSRQWNLGVFYVTRFGPKTSGSLGYRHIRFLGTGEGNPNYRENALTASVSVQF